MTAVYGAAERAKLTATAAALEVNTGAQLLARHVEDRLRLALPDLDDATIGRVLVGLTTGDDLAALFNLGDELPPHQLWQVLAAAGLNLTRDEWASP